MGFWNMWCTLFTGVYCVLHVNLTTIWSSCCSTFERYSSQFDFCNVFHLLNFDQSLNMHFIVIHFTPYIWMCMSLLFCSCAEFCWLFLYQFMIFCLCLLLFSHFMSLFKCQFSVDHMGGSMVICFRGTSL